jgi:hypothetical protein
MRWYRSAAVVVFVLAPSSVFAQDVGGAPAPAAPGPAGEPAPVAPAGQTQVSGTYLPPVIRQTTTTGPGAQANPDAHLGSGSQAKTDINQGDTFDYGRGGGESKVIGGRQGAPGIFDKGAQSNTGVYVVEAGDTLSKISERVFGNPWDWPKLWSLNTQIQNPHWIYPGDQIRLTGGGGATPMAKATRTLGTGVDPLRPQLVPEDSVFLRQLGYIDDPSKGIKGEIVGAVEPVQMMAEGQHIYIVLKPGETVSVGQTMTVFREVRDPPKIRDARTPPGKIVALKGSVEVEYVNLKTRVVRAVIRESTDTIERGAKVGFVEHRHRIVPPRKAKSDVTARVLTSMHPHVMMGQHQVVFIDRGSQDGLEAGTRLFVTRRGDTWRRTLGTTTHFARTRIELDAAEPLAYDLAPLHGDEQDFPEEVVAELRVVRAHKFSALALVSDSKVEVVPGDRAIARGGF